MCTLLRPGSGAHFFQTWDILVYTVQSKLDRARGTCVFVLVFVCILSVPQFHAKTQHVAYVLVFSSPNSLFCRTRRPVPADCACCFSASSSTGSPHALRQRKYSMYITMIMPYFSKFYPCVSRIVGGDTGVQRCRRESGF